MDRIPKIILGVITLAAIVSADEPGLFWIDPDIVIDSSRDYHSLSVATRRSNGEIFVAASARFFEDTTRYGIRVWRSSDGVNWARYLWFSAGNGNLFNPSMTVFTTADSEYLFIAFQLNRDTTPANYDIRALRRNLITQTDAWLNIATAPSQREMEPNICDNNVLFPNNPLLFCAYRINALVDSICFVRSTDYGITWSQRRIIGNGDANNNYCSKPDCDFGLLSTTDSSFVGVAWEVSGSETPEIRFRLNTYNGLSAHWRPIKSFTPPTGYEEGKPRLRMTFGHPSAVITHVRWDSAGNADLCRSVTTDGGETWSTFVHYNSTTAYNVPHSLGVDESLGYYHLAFRDQIGDMKYMKARHDSTSALWSPPLLFSSGNISDEDFPAIGVRNGEPYVSWVDNPAPALAKLKFDAQWLQSAITELNPVSLPNPVTVSPNLARGSFRIGYQVNKPGGVNIGLFDAAGRQVMNLLEPGLSCGRHEAKVMTDILSQGVYFIGVETPDGRWAGRVVVLR